MSKSYEKECRDCRKRIRMEEINNRWHALNFDNSPHRCSSGDRDASSYDKTKTQRAEEPQPQAQREVKPLTLESLDQRLKRVEKMLFQDAA